MAISKKKQKEIMEEISDLTKLNGDFNLVPFIRNSGTIGYKLTKEEGEYGKPNFSGFFTIYILYDNKWVRSYSEFSEDISKEVLHYIKEIYGKNKRKINTAGVRHRMLFGGTVEMKLVFAEYTDELQAKIKRSRATYKDLDSYTDGKKQTLFNDEAVESSDTFDLLMKNKEYQEKKENSEEFKKKLEKKVKRKNVIRKKKSLSGSRFIDHDKLIEKTQKTIGHSEITFFREEGNG